MPSVDLPTWRWRASLGWALLGPSIVLLVQFEALLVAAEALGVVDLGAYGHRTSLLVAISVLVLVAAAQASTVFWRQTLPARKELLKQRRAIDATVFRLLRAGHIRKGEHLGWEADEPENEELFMAVHVLREEDMRLEKREPEREHRSARWGFFDITIPSRRLRHFARLLRSKEREYLYSKRFVSRFGLEPTWAFEMLAELGLPAAQQISRRATLIDARAAGDLTALLFGVVAAEVLGFGLTNSTGMTADLWTSVVGLVVVLLIVGRFWAAVTSRKTFLRNEEQFYPQVERLLELHRFDLYRSLALQPPRDADQEREVSLAEWRRGDGGPAYALGEGQVDAADNMRQQMTGLTDLLRGPELVAYEGFVSWEVRGDGVLLMFASTPLLPGGSARVEVEGSATDRYAPFELTANSQDVALVQVRAAVQAPVDGRPSQVTFDFSGQEAAKHEVPVIWIEIRQRGRFIRLLRVPLTTASARLPRSQTAAAAGDEAIHRNSDLAGAPDLPDHDRPKAPDRPDWPS